MKKMMAMMAVLLVAVMSQAANVGWNTGAIKTVGTAGVFGSNVGTSTTFGNALVLFWVDNAGSQGAAVGSVAGNTDTSTSAASVYNGTTTAPSFTASTKYWAQVIVTTSDGLWQQTSTVASFTVPGTGDAAINFLAGTGFDVVSNKMPAQWTSVPEPTSLALLALGAAAMGLRRKFRK